MRFLLVLLAILSGLVMPQTAGATRVQVAGMGTALHQEHVAAPQPEVCRASRTVAQPHHPLPYLSDAPLRTTLRAPACSIALTDRPLE
jgi:hypothetical protein